MIELKELINSFCSKRDYPKEAIKAINDTWEQISSAPDAVDEWNKASTMLTEKTGDLALQMEALDTVAEIAKVNRKTLHLLFYMCHTPYLKSLYEKAGIDMSVYEDTVADLKCKMYECYDLYGEWGCRVSGWFDVFFSMRKFALGRMQFEIKTCGEDVSLKCGKKINKDDKVLDMHIPVSDKPFSKENRIDAYKRAYDFFKDEFPDGVVVFRAKTWLLFPDNRKILSPTSNTIGFMDEFDIVRSGVYANHNELWRIFGEPFNGDASSLKRETSLQRAYADWISDGNPTGYGVGFFLYDGTNFIK